MNEQLFFEKLFINSELANDICLDLNISRIEYTAYSKQLSILRCDEIRIIKRIRSLYHNKKDLKGFRFINFNSFYNWYKTQYESQEGKCYYCKTDENIIKTLFDNKYHSRKRTTRGKHLEVERRDATDNLYNHENCVLACYFCNNDKSDIFDEHEYLEYLKDRKGFLNNEFKKINDNR